MPQADTTLAPNAARACSTRGPGIGAPAHRKVLRLGTGWPLSATFLARSVRKGVDAIVNVTCSSRINSIALRGAHTSSSTALARSMMGIIRPYMKPVWCAMGEAISTTSFSPSAMRSAYGRMFDISVLAECMAPLGSPVVPLV